MHVCTRAMLVWFAPMFSLIKFLKEVAVLLLFYPAPKGFWYTIMRHRILNLFLLIEKPTHTAQPLHSIINLDKLHHGL